MKTMTFGRAIGKSVALADSFKSKRIDHREFACRAVPMPCCVEPALEMRPVVGRLNRMLRLNRFFDITGGRVVFAANL